MRLATFTVGAVILTAASASAQDKIPAMSAQQEKAVVELKAQLAATLEAKIAMPLEAKIVKGAPFNSAEVITESVQTLADGNRIVQRTTGRVYRDSQGRMRREDDGDPGQVARITITDPVAQASYSLDPATRTAWKTPSDIAVAIMKRAAPADPGDIERKKNLEAELAKADEQKVKELKAKLAALNEEVRKVAEAKGAAYRTNVAEGALVATHVGWDEKTEKLPAQMIEGVMAEGTRVTRTIPAGAIGNEQPIVSVTEQWRSPDLQVLVMTRTSDPRTGESTYKLQNIVRGEQSRTFFDVPADYTVKESGIRKLAPAVK